ncbi:hypothetical protein DUZ99_00280 [Xylanibacillus composti]|uniref:Uncharacterized protein n=1 Tax=Xylanibacillus composti TaxID=1572762 RepID=A0A8J4M236_9BACL|nr:hypothetical protein [Xylanibacillus composti]MDT9723452.1 hypothetical protein [Xylanibacillus composti]GIQ68512.1 hypothetical protein XYCOK13_13360 [Xylanibacillus composti]
MTGLHGADLDNSLLKKRLLAALVRSQYAIADLLDHTAELRRSLPFPDEELAMQQRSAASMLDDWLRQAAGAVVARNGREQMDESEGTSFRRRRLRKRPASPWLADGVFRAGS